MGRSPSRAPLVWPLSLLALLTALTAEGRAAAAGDVRELSHDVPVDAAVTATAIGLVIGSELLKPELAPSQCRWCDRDGRADSLNGLDRGVRSLARWSAPKEAAAISDVTGFLVAPSAAFVGLAGAAVRDHAERETPVDVLLVLESVAIAALVNQAVKFSVARERPYAHARALAGASTPAPRADDNLSFYSGHTSLTFTLASASGTVASLRDYRLAPVVWGVGMSVAAVTGYLRIAADKHYVTDVLAGAVVGSALGVLIPLTFHGRQEETAAAAPPPGGVAPMTQLAGFGGAF